MGGMKNESDKIRKLKLNTILRMQINRSEICVFFMLDFFFLKYRCSFFMLFKLTFIRYLSVVGMVLLMKNCHLDKKDMCM